MNLTKEIDIKESQPASNIIDTYQNTTVNAGKNSVKVIRDSKGRFLIGNKESVGNKGGRPKKLSFEDWVADDIALKELIKKAMIDCDIKSFLILEDLLRQESRLN